MASRAAKARLTSASQPQLPPNCRNTSPARPSARRTLPLSTSVALWNTAERESLTLPFHRWPRAAATARRGAIMIIATVRAASNAEDG